MEVYSSSWTGRGQAAPVTILTCEDIIEYVLQNRDDPYEPWVIKDIAEKVAKRPEALATRHLLFEAIKREVAAYERELDPSG